MFVGKNFEIHNNESLFIGKMPHFVVTTNSTKPLMKHDVNNIMTLMEKKYSHYLDYLSCDITIYNNKKKAQ